MTFKNIFELILNKNPPLKDKVLSEKPCLRLSSLPSLTNLGRGNLDKYELMPNEIWVDCENHFGDIAVGTTFNILFPYHAVDKYIETEVTLKRIYVKLHKESDLLHRGGAALCLLYFADILPTQLDKLRPEGTKFAYAKHEIFFLAQHTIYDQLQALMKLHVDKQQ
jgi:hypothetical protein